MRDQGSHVSNRIDVDGASSHHKGFKGLAEWVMRKFRTLTHLAMLAPLYAVGCLIVGLAATPGIYFLRWIFLVTRGEPLIYKIPLWGVSVGSAYLMYGFSLILIVPAMNFLMRTHLKPWRGPYYSIESIPWYIHNGSTYLVRYTFLEFITPTPFNLLFLKLMGMKIGDGTIINTSHISDPSLIEMGRKVTIGGSVTLVAHYGQEGFLVLSPVKIGDRVTIGLRATIMGGVEIGEGAKILPNSVVMPKTKIPPGELWGGVPAQRIEVGISHKKVA